VDHPARAAVALILRVGFFGDELGAAAIAETDLNGKRRQLLLDHTTVLEAALQQVAEIRREAGHAPLL
jgi:hypothetical protein